jgi:branched-chain amino acid transport system ATP-binding protein
MADAVALRVADLRAGYGKMSVLHGISLQVRAGQIAVLLGANGVGKTTTLRAISGMVRPTSGTVELAGRVVDRCTPEETVRRGLGMVPGPPGVFREMTVRDNLAIGATPIPRDAFGARLDTVLPVFPVLRDRMAQRAGSLSGGEQRMLAIARALMGAPSVLLVDEPSMGLSPAMVGNVLRLLDSVRATGVTILMAEQNVSALEIADAAFVMEKGAIARAASGSDLASLRVEAARAYLGAPARPASRRVRAGTSAPARPQRKAKAAAR